MVRKNTKVKTVIFNLLIFMTLTAPWPFARAWHIETVDAEGLVGYGGTSLALDSSQNPHISYPQSYPYLWGLKYAYYDGSFWHIETVDPEEYTGEYNSIALDSFQNPHISYYGYLNDDLKYAYYDGSSWEIETVATIGDLEADTSIALDSSQNPHISYHQSDPYPHGLKYAYYDGLAWQIETVEEGSVGSCNSLTLDSSQNPHISYWGTAKYTYYDGSSWHIETVDAAPGVGEYTSMALDSSENPHISYYDFNNGDLKYAYFDGSSWYIEAVDTEGNVGEYTSIALDSSQNPHISYSDHINHDLKYAYYNGSSWQIETVDMEGYVGLWTSIALDTSDNPHISYQDYTNYDLKYAYAFENTPPSSFDLLEPPDGGEVSEPVTLDWEDSTDDDGHAITYDAWYATDPSFDPHDEVTELTDSTYTFPEGTFSDGTTYYWKVRAWDGYDETWSGPDPYWSFTVEEEMTDISVTHFSAESVRTGIELTWECADPGVGFNLYRSEEATGLRSKLRETINGELITGESPYVYLDSNVSDGVTYTYWLEAMDLGGAGETFGPATCTAGTFVPGSYALYQSRPNPARGTAVIAFDLPEDADVTLTVYDLSGRKVTTLVDEQLPAGTYERPISGLASGVYVYRLVAGEFSAARKMVVID